MRLISSGGIFENRLKEVFTENSCRGFRRYKRNLTNEIEVPCTKILDGDIEQVIEKKSSIHFL